MTMWCSAVGGIVTLILGLLATPFAVQGQPAKNVPRIGFLSAASPAALSARTEAFRQGLRELGYVAGKNIVIEWRYAEENLDRLPELAAEVVRLKVDVIVTAAPSSTRAAQEATAAIPIAWAGSAAIPWRRGSSPAWRGLAGTSRDSLPWRRSSAANNWSC